MTAAASEKAGTAAQAVSHDDHHDERRRSHRQWRWWKRTIGLLFGMLALFSAVGGAAWAQGTVPPANGIPANAGPWPHAAAWIVQPWATIALLVVGCSLIYQDLLTPLTWQATGTLGVIAVGLVFAAHVTVGGFGWVGVVLMLIGLAALLTEIHWFPGHGSAFAGFMLMFVGMFLSLGGTAHTAFALTVSSVLIVVSGLAFLAYLPKSPAWQKLGDEMHKQQAALFAAAHPLHQSADFAPPLPEVGAEGRTVSPLRPTGRADFGGVEHIVVTEGDFLEAGTIIVVSHLDGDRVVVEAVPSRSVAPVGEPGSVVAAG